ncbi:MAG: TonB-dependent receptor, partial [Bacteroidota bacterium]
SQIGGMTAQYGNAMSAVVSTTTKTGGPKYHFGLEIITDQAFGGKESKNFLGAYSYGLNEYVLTAGGPIIPGNERFRFFVAGQRIFNRSNPSYLDGINFPHVDSTDIVNADWIVTDRNAADGGIQTMPAGSTGNRGYLADLINQTDLPGGRTWGGYALDQWAIQGNVFMDFGALNVKIGGTYNNQSTRNQFGITDPFAGTVATQGGRELSAIAITAGDPRRFQINSNDWSIYAKLTHIVNPTTFYSIQASTWQYFQERGDPIWMDNVMAYGDPTRPENAVLTGPSLNPSPFSVWSFSANWPGTIPQDYRKLSRSNISGRIDFTKQFGRSWEFIVGGDITRHTIRTYGIDARDLYRARLVAPNASDWEVYGARLARDIGFFGYDIYGNEFEGGTFTDNTGYTVNLSDEGPKHPLTAGVYVQNKFEFSDLVINFGLRYDWINPGSREYIDPQMIAIDDLDGVPVVADSSYKDQEISTQLSPRIGFSFPVTDRTVFHATYGRFLQQGRLADLYDPRVVAGLFFQGGWARQFPTPNLKPERTTDYEVGFRQQIGDVASFDLSFYYKDIKDLHVIRVIFPNPGSQTQAWYANVNGDYGTSKGVQFTFQLRRTARIAMQGNYTISSSTATGSNSASQFNIAWQDASFNGQPYFPVIPTFTDFDRTHLGNINLDYRFGKDDGGPILERLGLNLLFRFSSGLRWTYSQITGFQAFSSTNAPEAFEGRNSSEGPWTYNLDLKLDKTVTLFNSVDLNVYLWIQNVFDRKNVTGLYTGTGEQNNDGYFQTSQGQTWAENNGSNAVEMYNYLQNNLNFLSQPRVVRLGVRLDI